MKELTGRQRGRTYVLSQDKSKFVDAPLSKRAGKQSIYYDAVSTPDTANPTTFSRFIRERAENGEVVLYRDSVEERGAEHERRRREEELRQLREAVTGVAWEDRLEDRLTTIILDFIAAVRHARAHRHGFSG